MLPSNTRIKKDFVIVLYLCICCQLVSIKLALLNNCYEMFLNEVCLIHFASNFSNVIKQPCQLKYIPVLCSVFFILNLNYMLKDPKRRADANKTAQIALSWQSLISVLLKQSLTWTFRVQNSAAICLLKVKGREQQVKWQNILGI